MSLDYHFEIIAVEYRDGEKESRTYVCPSYGADRYSLKYWRAYTYVLRLGWDSTPTVGDVSVEIFRSSDVTMVGNLTAENVHRSKIQDDHNLRQNWRFQNEAF